MKVKLTKKEEILLAETKTVDPEAYDAYLGGIYLLDQMNPQSLHAAIDSFEKAIEIEPDWAAPHAGIASSGARMRQMGTASESDVILMYEKLNRALELDPGSAESHSVKAGIAAWTEFDWKTAEEEFLKAIEANPSHASSHIFYAHVLSILRRTDEALYHGKIAQELDPENPFMLGLYVVVLLHAEKCQEAFYTMQKALTIDPDHYFLRDGLKGIYVCLGDYEKAFEVWKGGMNRSLWEEYGVTELFEKVFRERGWIALVEEAIRVNEEVWAKDGRMDIMGQAGRFVRVGKYDRAMDYYEKIYENNNRNPNLPYLSTKPTYDKMKGNPRYLALLEKMNLPVSDE
jgi:tetratricopeptide (TPR) repeat protein